jgi:hypothetical protein
MRHKNPHNILLKVVSNFYTENEVCTMKPTFNLSLIFQTLGLETCFIPSSTIICANVNDGDQEEGSH